METNFFCGNTLDRLSEKRNDMKFIENILKDPLTGFYVFYKSFPLAKEYGRGQDFKLYCLDYEDVRSFKRREKPLEGAKVIENEENNALSIFESIILLGEDRSHDCKTQLNCAIDHEKTYKYLFALDVSNFKEEIDKIILQKNVQAKFLRSRFEMFRLRNNDAALSALSLSMLDWNRRYKFCATCGAHTKSQDAGYRRTCLDEKCISNNGVHNTSYPRTDPVVISAVASKDNTRLLLGRKKQFPDNMYSCLAGFMEPGESVEETARREIKEESGIDVHEVKYLSSQPWPYPSALMIGCISQAINEDIVVCIEELEDVKWFDFEAVKAAVEGVQTSPGLLSIPPRQTIANRLIRYWVKERCKILESKI